MIDKYLKIIMISNFLLRIIFKLSAKLSEPNDLEKYSVPTATCEKIVTNILRAQHVFPYNLTIKLYS